MLQVYRKRAFIISFVICAFLLSSSALVFLNRTGRLTPVWRTKPLVGQIRENRNAYIARSGVRELSWPDKPTPALILEDGKPLPGPGNVPLDEVREAGLGRYAYLYDYVYFSSSDNSDPATNGRVYSIHYPYKLANTIADGLYLLTLLALGVTGIMIIFPFAGRIERLVRNGISERSDWLMRSWRNDRAGILQFFRELGVPASVAAIYPIYLLFTFPPLFSGTDAACYYSFTLRDWTPHYKPGYLGFVRLINNGLALRLSDPFASTDVGFTAVYTVVVIQHLLSVFAIAYFAATLSRSPYVKGLIAGALGLLPIIFIYSHGIFQESLLIPLVIILCASILRLQRQERLRNWPAWMAGGALYLMLMIRHDPLPLYLLPLLSFAVIWLFDRRSELCRKRLQKMMIATIVSFLAYAVTMQMINRVLGTSGRPSIYGRAGSYFIVDSDVWRDLEQRQRMIDEIRSRMTDPDAIEAVAPVINSTVAWTEHYRNVARIVARQHPDWYDEEQHVRTEQILNEIFTSYLRLRSEYYLRTVRSYLLKHLSYNLLDDISYPMRSSIWLFETKRDWNIEYHVFRTIPLTSDPSTPRRYEHQKTMVGNALARFYGTTPTYGTLFVIGALLLVVTLFAGRARPKDSSQNGSKEFWINASFLIFGLGYIVMMSMAQPPLERYHNVGAILLFISISMTAVRLGAGLLGVPQKAARDLGNQ